MIISHKNNTYKERWERLGIDRYNGAYYYSREIVKNIIPNVKTKRSWMTVNVPGRGEDGMIVFVHNNLHPENYEWLSKYKDIVLVCGVPETVDKVKRYGHAIYLPLSIDVEYVKQFALPKSMKAGAAFAGRRSKRNMPGVKLPDNIKMLEGYSRKELLKTMAQFEEIYGVGRTALEAVCLGCKVKAYDPRYPDPDVWKVIDNKEAAKLLQKALDDIDGIKRENPKPKKKTAPKKTTTKRTTAKKNITNKAKAKKETKA